MTYRILSYIQYTFHRNSITDYRVFINKVMSALVVGVDARIELTFHEAFYGFTHKNKARSSLDDYDETD